MNKSKLAIVLLSVALVASNTWWAYRVLDAGISCSYLSVSAEESQQGLAQALAIIKATTNPGATRAEVVAAARTAWPYSEPFEKEGYLWVGRLGLRFNEAGQLVDAVSGL